MTNPVVTPASFLQDYPEFSNSTKYPNSAIQYWINVAVILLNPNRWGTMLTTGIELYVAHNLVLEGQAQAAAATGGTPGQNTGPLNSKTVDKVSAGYDTGAASIEGAGAYNLTTYGTRFYQLMLMFGSGGAQL
jgi:hypothetical protein